MCAEAGPLFTTTHTMVQAWKVRFVGEGGHDVGGMYNESMVEICNELQSDKLPLFIRCVPHTTL